MCVWRDDNEDVDDVDDEDDEGGDEAEKMTCQPGQNLLRSPE